MTELDDLQRYIREEQNPLTRALALEVLAYRSRCSELEAAIRDIDAHATPLGGEEFVEGGYLISIGCLHRALALLGQIPAAHFTAHIPPEARI